MTTSVICEGSRSGYSRYTHESEGSPRTDKSSLFVLVSGPVVREAKGHGEPMIVGAFKRGELWDNLYLLKSEQDKFKVKYLATKSGGF